MVLSSSKEPLSLDASEQQMTNKRPLWLTTALLWAGCVTPAVAPDATPQAGSPHPGEPDALLSLATADSRASSPTWLEDDRARRDYAPNLGEPRMLAVGVAVSLHKTLAGIVALRDDLGVLGTIVLPEQAVWVGVDGQDQLWAASTDGGLWSASADDALSEGGFKSRARFEGAQAWDANARYLAIAVKDRLHISEDYGKSWSVKTPAPGLELRKVFVRADGVIAVIGLMPSQDGPKRYTYLSPDAGSSWELSSFQPEQLRRDGAWIWNADMNCVAKLAADGKTWSADPSLSQLPGHHDAREAMLALSHSAPEVMPSALFAGAKAATMTWPPAPKAPPAALRHVDRAPNCQDPIPTAADLARARALQAQDQEQEQTRGVKPPACQGSRCLLRAAALPSPQSTTTHMLLHDGRCDMASCARAPHSATFQEGVPGFSVQALPEGCRPRHLWSLKGLGVLWCAADDTKDFTLYTRAAQGLWRQEYAGRAQRFKGASVAEDGTIVLHGQCEGSRCMTSLVRSPLESGEQGAWRPIKVKDALWASAATAGRAIVLAAPVEAQHQQVMIWEDTPQGQRRLATLDELELPLWGVESVEGQVVLRLGDEFQAARWSIRKDGQLVPFKAQ